MIGPLICAVFALVVFAGVMIYLLSDLLDWLDRGERGERGHMPRDGW